VSALVVHVDGVGLFGPGMSGWAEARPVLDGSSPLALAPLKLPAAEALPPAERRRAGLAIRLSMAIAFDAAGEAGADPSRLPTVFSSSSGDCDNCHNILESLASPERAVSPTRFHNSVHNAPAGYWSIATGCMEPSTSLAAYDASFTAGLLEAATQARSSARACLMLAFDTAYPEPLYSLRPIPHPFGIGLVVSPARTEATQATLALSLTEAPATVMADKDLEGLRRQIPTARGLPLLQHVARGDDAEVVIEYLEGLNLAVQVSR
jgi:Beta-ketoacyl synthase, N-terminal domain